MFRTRLFGASLVLSILINIAIVALLGAFGLPAFHAPPQEPLKTVRIKLYHPPVEKPARQTRKLVISKKARIVRANPAPRSAYPPRRIAASHSASPGRAPIRVAAPIRRTPPLLPTHLAQKEQPARNIAPAADMPKVLTANKMASLPAPTSSQDQGNSAATAPSEPAPASGSAGGNGDHERIGSAPGPGGDGGGGPFGIGPGGGGEGPRHIAYVLDVSPSMKTRIDRARQELRDALATLEPDESFDIIAFGGGNKLLADQLVPADPKEIHDANQFLDRVEFIPGTDLEDALYEALSLRGVNVVVLITDGVPTVGETDFGKIARHIRKHNRPNARIYTIGLVGVNPDGTDQSFEAGQLLKQLARDSGGDSRLVPLGEATPDE